MKLDPTTNTCEGCGEPAESHRCKTSSFKRATPKGSVTCSGCGGPLHGKNSADVNKFICYWRQWHVAIGLTPLSPFTPTYVSQFAKWYEDNETRVATPVGAVVSSKRATTPAAPKITAAAPASPSKLPIPTGNQAFAQNPPPPTEPNGSKTKEENPTALDYWMVSEEQAIYLKDDVFTTGIKYPNSPDGRGALRDYIIKSHPDRIADWKTWILSMGEPTSSDPVEPKPEDQAEPTPEPKTPSPVGDLTPEQVEAMSDDDVLAWPREKSTPELAARRRRILRERMKKVNAGTHLYSGGG